MGLQTIVSRETILTENAAVISIGSIQGGVRSNIIPEQVKLIGTIRTLNKQARDHMYEAIPRKVKGIADSMRAEAELILTLDYQYPVTCNDPELMDIMLPTLHRTAGDNKVDLINAVMGAEDFSFFQEKVPGVHLFVGGKPLNVPKENAPAHHTRGFYVDDSGMNLGVKLLTNLTLDYMQHSGSKK